MILIREDDAGTDVYVPRLHPDDLTQVAADRYASGLHVGSETVPVAKWRVRQAELQSGGYVESDDRPELVATIDRGDARVCIAGDTPVRLDTPRTGTDDDSLVDQADEVIAAAGYLRLVAWWMSDDGRHLRARILPDPPSDIPIEVRPDARVCLAVAAGHLRGALADIPGDDATADWLRLAEEPTHRDHRKNIGALLSRPYDVHLLAALTAYRTAVKSAISGDRPAYTYWAGAVPARLATR